MANWILFGILIGIFLFSTIIVCWQLVMTILEVRGILKVVRELTEDVKPTLHEVNEILRKSNLAMDEAGETYQTLGEKAKQARSGFSRLKVKVRNWVLALQTGVEQAMEVYQHDGQPPLALPEHTSSSQVPESVLP